MAAQGSTWQALLVEEIQQYSAEVCVDCALLFKSRPELDIFVECCQLVNSAQSKVGAVRAASAVVFRDWSIEVRHPCQCEHCIRIIAFLLDPITQTTLEYGQHAVFDGHLISWLRPAMHASQSTFVASVLTPRAARKKGSLEIRKLLENRHSDDDIRRLHDVIKNRRSSKTILDEISRRIVKRVSAAVVGRDGGGNGSIGTFQSGGSSNTSSQHAKRMCVDAESMHSGQEKVDARALK